MIGLILILFGVLPFALGFYAWRAMRRDDEGSGDEPPPPPEPRAPRPIVPPTPRRYDRGPAPRATPRVTGGPRVRR